MSIKRVPIGGSGVVAVAFDSSGGCSVSESDAGINVSALACRADQPKLQSKPEVDLLTPYVHPKST